MAGMDEDLLLALRLQEEWGCDPEPASLVDASWELVDPTPDLQALFVQFNDQFFWGRLEAVEVKWSVRMTLCAGTCSYEGSGGMCTIRLSEPLLKLRPRKDLVETLLHEMIHAYLFVTNNDKDREGHGPEFCKHMNRINHLTGANISVYHTFYDEVDEYRRHWWRCNGPCQYEKPYYGYVKRATNRAPSAHDYWWAKHQKTCGGTYIKIKEPENYAKKGKGKMKPGQHLESAGENKDKSSRGEARQLIPFSGKGYVLGKTGSLASSAKSTSSEATSTSQDLTRKGHSGDAPGQNSKVEVKYEQSSSNKKTHLVSPVLNANHQSVLSNYFSRVSVANPKAFRSENGSPVKCFMAGDTTTISGPCDSQRWAASSDLPPRNSSKALEETAVTTTQVVSRPEEKFSNKRPRLEDKTAFNNFFIKKKKIQSGSSDPKYSASPTTTTQNFSTPSSQSEIVNCPVCHNAVLNSEINEHLDWCLENDSIRVKADK